MPMSALQDTRKTGQHWAFLVHKVFNKLKASLSASWNHRKSQAEIQDPKGKAEDKVNLPGGVRSVRPTAK